MGISEFYDGVSVTETTVNSCTGQGVSVTNIPSAWNINAPSILSIGIGQSKSRVAGLSLGTSNFQTLIHGWTYSYYSGSCLPHPTTVVASGSGMVQQPDDLSVASDNTFPILAPSEFRESET